MQIGSLLAISANIIENLADFFSNSFVFIGPRDDAGQEVGDEVVQKLGEIVFGKNSAKQSQVGCSDSVLLVDVPNLFVEGRPEPPHVTSHEEAGAQGRPAVNGRLNGQMEQLALPGPGCVDGKLFVFSELFFFFFLDLPPNFSDGRQRYLLHLITGVEKP